MYSTNNWSCKLFRMKIKMLNRLNFRELMPVVDYIVAMRYKQTSCADVNFRNIMRICKDAY